jgi:hypothetical protein
MVKTSLRRLPVGAMGIRGGIRGLPTPHLTFRGQSPHDILFNAGWGKHYLNHRFVRIKQHENFRKL